VRGRRYSIEGIFDAVDRLHSVTLMIRCRGGVCMKLEECTAECLKIFRRNSDTRDPIFYPFF